MSRVTYINIHMVQIKDKKNLTKFVSEKERNKSNLNTSVSIFLKYVIVGF